MNEENEVIIIGGGIIGLSSAFYLQRSGISVTVIDQSGFSGNCSFGNAGYVCPSHFVPLAAPGIVRQGLKWMFNSRSPFYIRPSLSPALLSWATKFVRSASQKNVRDAALPLRDISLLSQHEFEKWHSGHAIDFFYQREGLLELFQSRGGMRHARETCQKAAELGLEAVLLDRAALEKLEPDIHIDALGGLLFKCDAHLYPDQLMRALHDRVVQQGGRLKSETVTDMAKNKSGHYELTTNTGTYKAKDVVIATGAWSRKLAQMIGVSLPLIPGRGYSVTGDYPSCKLKHPAILSEGRVAVTPLPMGKYRFGGTMEVVPVTTPVRYNRMEGIINTVNRFFPDLGIPLPQQKDIWSGFRPCSADGLPYIGRLRHHPRIVIATGHSMMGLSLGPGTGKLVAELVMQHPTSIPIKAFDPERFSRSNRSL